MTRLGEAISNDAALNLKSRQFRRGLPGSPERWPYRGIPDAPGISAGAEVWKNWKWLWEMANLLEMFVKLGKERKNERILNAWMNEQINEGRNERSMIFYQILLNRSSLGHDRLSPHVPSRKAFCDSTAAPCPCEVSPWHEDYMTAIWIPCIIGSCSVHVQFMFGSCPVHVLKHPSLSLYLASPSKSMKISRAGHHLPCCQWKYLIALPAEELRQISWDARRTLATSGEETSRVMCSCVAFGWDWNGQKKSSKWWLALSLIPSHKLPMSPT